MFTGIIEDIGIVKSFKPQGRVWHLIVHSKIISKGLKIGQSIAVNGVCLTAVKVQKPDMYFDIQPETLRCTQLGSLKKGDGVNLEAAMKASGRLDGHMVQGHVDTIGTVEALEKINKDRVLKIKLPKPFLKYLAVKGSISVSGVSLTITEIRGNIFSVHLIPHTLAKTNLQHLRSNGKVNIEVDILAKYMERLLKNV